MTSLPDFQGVLIGGASDHRRDHARGRSHRTGDPPGLALASSSFGDLVQGDFIGLNSSVGSFLLGHNSTPFSSVPEDLAIVQRHWWTTAGVAQLMRPDRYGDLGQRGRRPQSDPGQLHRDGSHRDDRNPERLRHLPDGIDGVIGRTARRRQSDPAPTRTATESNFPTLSRASHQHRAAGSAGLAIGGDDVYLLSGANTIGGVGSGNRHLRQPDAGIFVVQGSVGSNVDPGQLVGTDLTGTKAIGTATVSNHRRGGQHDRRHDPGVGECDLVNRATASIWTTSRREAPSSRATSSASTHSASRHWATAWTA